MKMFSNIKLVPPLILAIVIALPAVAQVATLDISNPTNPIVTYDANPYIFAPDLPPDPTAIYLDALTIPSGTALVSQLSPFLTIGFASN